MMASHRRWNGGNARKRRSTSAVPSLLRGGVRLADSMPGRRENIPCQGIPTRVFSSRATFVFFYHTPPPVRYSAMAALDLGVAATRGP